MFHVVIGLTFLGLGLWGAFDEWYYLKDLISGAVPVGMVLFGIIAIWTVIISDENKTATNGE